MNNRQEPLLRAANAAIARATHFAEDHPRIAEAVARLRSAVTAADSAGVAQTLARQSRKSPRYSLSRAKKILFEKHLNPIAADGREMFRGMPGIRETLRLPPIKAKPERHLEAARRIRRIAEEHEREFIDERKYAGDFLARFDAALEDLEAAARADRGAGRQKYTHTTAEVKLAIDAVRDTLDSLDAHVRGEFMDDPVTLGLWRHSARRNPPKTGRPSNAEKAKRAAKAAKSETKKAARKNHTSETTPADAGQVPPELVWMRPDDESQPPQVTREA